MKIGIVGLGLIGGSLGLDLRALGHEVLGVSRQPQTCHTAIERGAVDFASMDLASLASAQVIFLCTPLGSLLTTVQQLVPHLQPETILTDVGSVKAPVVKQLSPLWRSFVGGHPMAGTAETGIQAALRELFVNRPYVLTPVETTPASAVTVVAELVKSLRSQLYTCAPAVHDQAVALISHLPVFVSANLIATCTQTPQSEILQLAQQLASSGFRDTSRVGGGNPELGRMMAEYNREALLNSLRQYQQNLAGWIQAIEDGRWSEIEERLVMTQQQRPKFLAE